MLTVIIPTYNRRDLIKFTLDSLDKRNHHSVDFEVIVIDDGSTDKSIDFIRTNYPEVRVLVNNGKGAPSARNTGLYEAKGKYIMYLDSDDLVGANYFGGKVELLESRPDMDACYGEYDCFESNEELTTENIIFKFKYPQLFSENNSKEHLINYLSGNFLPPNAIIWRKDFLIKCKGHDTSLSVNQDVDLFIRAIFNGLKMVAVNDNTKVYIRHHSLDNRVGNPGNSQKKWQQILDLRKKIFNDLKANGFNDTAYYAAISSYLFGYWKTLRHTNPDIATKYLKSAREIFWPVPIRGNIVYRSLAMILGPVNLIKAKYFILKRD